MAEQRTHEGGEVPPKTGMELHIKVTKEKDSSSDEESSIKRVKMISTKPKNYPSKSKVKSFSKKEQYQVRSDNSNFVCRLERCIPPTKPHLWLLDSGCASHVCYDLRKFDTVKVFRNTHMYMANGPALNILGAGTVNIRFCVEPNLIRLDNVYYAPQSRFNILSVSKLIDAGYSVTFSKRFARVKKDNVLIYGFRKHDIYYMSEWRWDTKSPEMTIRTLLKWHERYGHPNLQEMRELCKAGILRSVSLEDFPQEIPCELCAQNKQYYAFGSKTDTKARRQQDDLKIDHSKGSEPIRSEPRGQYHFLESFADQGSKWSKAYLIQQSRVLNKFSRLNTKIKNMTGRKFEYIELVSEDDSNNFSKPSDVQEIPEPHTSQQSENCERQPESYTIWSLISCCFPFAGIFGSKQ